MFALLFLSLTACMVDSLDCRMVGRWPFGIGYVPKEVVSESILYVRSGGGLCILDVTDARAPKRLAELGTLGTPSYLSRKDSLLCVGEYEAGVALYNVSNPAKPILLGRHMTPDIAMGVSFDGRYAYVAAVAKGLRIVDFANPQDPKEIGFYDTPGYAADVAVNGKYAYVADVQAGLRIIHIEDPTRPCEIGSYVRTNDFAREVRVSDTLVYVAFELGGLVILNVANPTRPVELSVTPLMGTMQVAVQDSFAYVTTTNRPFAIKIVNVASPTEPRVVGSYPSPSDDGFCGVAVRGNRCYTFWTRTVESAVMGIDITDPTRPTLLGTYSGIPAPTDVVAVKNSLVLAGTRGDGLKTYDVSDPAQTRLLGGTGDTSRVGGIAVKDNHAYLACWHGDIFRVVDVSDPQRPRQVGGIGRYGFGHDVVLQGTYAYLAEGEYLRVVNVEDPSQPIEAGSVHFAEGAFGVEVEGGYCYVANWYGGIRVVDISNPTAPVEVGSCRTPAGAASDVKLCFPYLYYADVAGFGIVDVSNPTQPSQIAYIPYQYPQADCWGLDVWANLAYVGVGWSGMKVYDVSNPAEPKEVGFYDTPGWTYHVWHHDGKTYVADYDGFCILEYYGPSPGVGDSAAGAAPAGVRLAAIPSPTTNKVTVEFTVPIRCSGTVKLCDITGRTLGTLFAGAVWPGDSRLELSAEKLPAGTYFIVLQTGGTTQQARFTVP